MIPLLRAEVRRQTGRRGSFYGSFGFALLIAVITLVWALTTSSDPSGSEILNNGAGLLAAVVVICSVILGAIAGAYDVDQGTMRYLVLTGRPRWQLVIVRYLGLFCTLVLFTLPALMMIGLIALALGDSSTPTVQGDPVGFNAFLEMLYVVWVSGALYGLLALSIGTFLKSNGVAIAVAIVLNFAGVLAAALIWEFVSHTGGDVFYPILVDAAISREAQSAGGAEGDGSSLALGTSLFALGVWIAALIGAAIWRVQRSEY
ncbi:MAG: ABC transporter permease subunit [Thermoleophilaceae bacterium]|nr:ABC transporter permease subunit [Thermoleophilaceae bacterium]